MHLFLSPSVLFPLSIGIVSWPAGRPAVLRRVRVFSAATRSFAWLKIPFLPFEFVGATQGPEKEIT